MTKGYNLCIIKPNKDSFSETFITEHINRLSGDKKVLYGGAFPVYDDKGKFLIRSTVGLLSYLLQKRIFKKQNIRVRNKALVNYLAQEKIDAVFAEYGTVGAMVTEACKEANVPLIVNFHGADAHQQNNVKTFLPLYKKMFEYACAIVAVSNEMIETLVELGAPREKVFWNSCGVNTGKFSIVNPITDNPNFLSVGRFVPKKSPESVIKAFKLVSEEIPEAHLWMVGDGPLLETSKKLAEALGINSKITFTGVLTSDKIKELLNKTRCFVQHSVTAIDGDKEGTPVTVLEASASGLPVVSTSHAGIKDAIIDGVTGYLVAENDIKGMADKMLRVANSLPLSIEMGKAGRNHIIANYNLPDRIRTLDQIIQGCISK